MKILFMQKLCQLQLVILTCSLVRLHMTKSPPPFLHTASDQKGCIETSPVITDTPADVN